MLWNALEGFLTSIQTPLLACCILEGVTGPYTVTEEEMGCCFQGMWCAFCPY